MLACRSYPVTLFMNIPWVVLHFPLYETSKLLMAPERNGNEGPAIQIAAGGIAGGVAAALVSLCASRAAQKTCVLKRLVKSEID